MDGDNLIISTIKRLLFPAPPAFKDGIYAKARQTPANPGRIGGTIVPSALVVHTTDTAPGLFGNIIKYWQREVGQGECAHFMIGRTEADGVVQFVPINRNGNHAGGPSCGHFTPTTKAYGPDMHPNLVTVGVELDAAGPLRREVDRSNRATGNYTTWDNKHIIPAEDVYTHTDGTPWHKVTDYQMARLKELWADLYPTLKPWNYKAVPGGTYPQKPWAVNKWNNLVGHCTLNPSNKTDPGPQVMAWVTS